MSGIYGIVCPWFMGSWSVGSSVLRTEDVPPRPRRRSASRGRSWRRATWRRPGTDQIKQFTIVKYDYNCKKNFSFFLFHEEKQIKQQFATVHFLISLIREGGKTRSNKTVYNSSFLISFLFVRKTELICKIELINKFYKCKNICKIEPKTI